MTLHDVFLVAASSMLGGFVSAVFGAWLYARGRQNKSPLPTLPKRAKEDEPHTRSWEMPDAKI